MRKVVSRTTQPTPPDGQTSAPKPTALPFQWSPAISCHVANGRGVQSTPNPSYTPKENVVYKNKNTFIVYKMTIPSTKIILSLSFTVISLSKSETNLIYLNQN